MKRLLALTVAVAAFSTVAHAEGLEVGSSVEAFYVKDVTGPKAGTKLCYRCNYGDRPVVSVFTREVNDDVKTLIKKIDDAVSKNEEKKMGAFMVLLSNEPASSESTLKKTAEESKIAKTPLTTFDSVEGPAAYKISKDADVTVMMWVNGKLQVNEAFKKGELTEDKIASVMKETKKILN